MIPARNKNLRVTHLCWARCKRTMWRPPPRRSGEGEARPELQEPTRVAIFAAFFAAKAGSPRNLSLYQLFERRKKRRIGNRHGFRPPNHGLPFRAQCRDRKAHGNPVIAAGINFRTV